MAFVGDNEGFAPFVPPTTNSQFSPSLQNDDGRTTPDHRIATVASSQEKLVPGSSISSNVSSTCSEISTAAAFTDLSVVIISVTISVRNPWMALNVHQEA